MKKSHAILFAVCAVLIFAAIALFRPMNVPLSSTIEGCYVAHNGRDVYTLHILSQKSESVTGTLAFNNFEKDSSSGTFAGTYKEGVLLADYSFRSEGMDSIMQVLFKKSGNDFIRGYGTVSEDGTHFVDTANATYDSSSDLSVFKKTTCVQ